MVDGTATPPLCVLGMRTGSSLTTRVLALLGADPGPDAGLMEGRPGDNPKGFWEQTSLVALNDELLARLGGPWWDLPPLAEGWHRDPALDLLREQARSLIADLFPEDRQWVWKDPRASVTLPFWREVIGDMRYVITVRSPAEVAASLHARDPVAHPWRKSTRVFFRFLAAGLAHTDGADRIVVFYEDWFDDLDAQVERLARFAFGGPPRNGARADIRAFFESRLRHHEVVDDELDPEIAEAYATLRAATDGSGRLAPEAAMEIERRWSRLSRRIDGDGHREVGVTPG